MIGPQSTLRDIVLEELPDQVRLLCDENLQEEEVEPQEDYKVYANCGHCNRHLKLQIRATASAVRLLQELLLGDLDLVCPRCSEKYN